jgi:DDE superfamily endonuclease
LVLLSVYLSETHKIWSKFSPFVPAWTLSSMAPSERSNVQVMSPSRRISTAVKKKHTLKNNLVIDIEEHLVRYLSETYAGRIHDKRICDIEELVFPPEINLFQDTGFQGHQPPGVTIYQPKKKPKGQELTVAEQAENQIISSIRIRIEHIISSVKRCRIVKDIFRNTKAFFADQVMEIACGLHNFRTLLRDQALE